MIVWNEERLAKLSKNEILTLVTNIRVKNQKGEAERIDAFFKVKYGHKNEKIRKNFPGSLTKEIAMISCKAAIAEILNGEGDISRQAQQRIFFDEAFAKKWLTYWMLQRTVKKHHQATLAEFMTEVMKPTILSASDDHAKIIVVNLAKQLKSREITSGIATSLASKFAFSLKPEVYVPYDKRAREGIRNFNGIKIQDHDYGSYLDIFFEFVVAFKLFLSNCGLIAEVQDLLRMNPSVQEGVFFYRSADKALMLMGGFNQNRMSLAV